MPMQGELPVRRARSRLPKASQVVWSKLAAGIELRLAAGFLDLVYLTATNAVRYFPSFGAGVAVLDHF